MEEASDPLIIPGWIWFVLVVVVIGALVTLVIRRDRRSGHRSRSRGSSRRRSHRHSTTRSRHRRPRDPFEKL